MITLDEFLEKVREIVIPDTKNEFRNMLAGMLNLNYLHVISRDLLTSSLCITVCFYIKRSS